MVLEELTRLTGVSGAEGPVRDYIMEKARPLCDQMWVDRMGNLLCRVEGGTLRPAWRWCWPTWTKWD